MKYPMTISLHKMSVRVLWVLTAATALRMPTALRMQENSNLPRCDSEIDSDEFSDNTSCSEEIEGDDTREEIEEENDDFQLSASNHHNRKMSGLFMNAYNPSLPLVLSALFTG